MDLIRFNLITFTSDKDGAGSLGGLTARRLFLKMESAYVRQPGVTTQNPLTAIVPYTELAKLGDLDDPETLADVRGKVEFWHQAAPDTFDADGNQSLPAIRIDNMRLVDVEPVEWGHPVSGGAGRVVIFRIHLADERERFAEPRGGRLGDGELNAEPFNLEPGDDYHSGGMKDKNGRPVLTTRQLIQKCLDEMGLSDVTIPGTVDLTSAGRNIEWRGNHAPSELQKIMDAIGHVFYVRLDGGFRIERVFDGQTPESNPDQVIEANGFSMPGVDRRGKVVIFASYPNPVLNLQTISGLESTRQTTPPARKWQLVCQDSRDRWQTYMKCDVLGGKGGLEIIRNNFMDIAPAYRARVASQLFRCLRLDPGEFGINAIIYRRAKEKDAQFSDMRIEARIAIEQADGSWKQSTDFVRLTPQWLFDDGTIVQVRERIGKLKDEVAEAGSFDPKKDFAELADNELRGRVMTEVSEKLADGTRKATYYMVGFRAGVGGAIEQLSEKELQDYLAAKDSERLIVAKPELQLLQRENEDQNRKELELLAKDAAFRFVQGTGDPAKLYLAKGFKSVNLSGKVAEVRISQVPPETRWTINTWFWPHASYVNWIADKKEDSSIAGGPGTGGGAFPYQQPLAASRKALGASGSTEVATLVAPTVADPPLESLRVVTLSKGEGDAYGSDGTLTTPPSWKYDVFALGGGKLLDKASPDVARPYGSFTPAVLGIAYRKASGTWALLVAFETETAGGCST